MRSLSDDWTMAAACVFAILTSATGALGAHYGMGSHIASLEVWQITTGIKYVWFARIFAAIAFGILKLSIALLFLRIVKMKKVYRYIINFTIAANGIVTFIWVLMTFKCVPPFP